jgi:4-amino-4-deoxy-L-arabinose transferase-like glycosyltransferase
VHAGLGIATVALLFATARLWGLGGDTAFVAALLVALDPILLNQSTLIMTETLAALLAVLGLHGLTRLADRPSFKSATVAGAVLGLASLCRPTFLVWSVLVLTVLLWRVVRWRLALRWPVLLLLSMTVVIAPWVVRNAWVLGRPVVATTHGGYTLLLGNNARFYDFLRHRQPGEVWDSRELDAEYSQFLRESAYDEVRADRWAYGRAIATMRGQPRMFAQACVVRQLRLWGLVPHRIDAHESATNRLLRYAVGVWYALVLVLAIVGAVIVRGRLVRHPWLWGVLLCLAFTAAHTVYWSNLRMRAPLMPVVCIFAAVGAVSVWRRLPHAQHAAVLERQV